MNNKKFLQTTAGRSLKTSLLLCFFLVVTLLPFTSALFGIGEVKSPFGLGGEEELVGTGTSSSFPFNITDTSPQDFFIVNNTITIEDSYSANIYNAHGNVQVNGKVYFSNNALGFDGYVYVLNDPLNNISDVTVITIPSGAGASALTYDAVHNRIYGAFNGGQLISINPDDNSFTQIASVTGVHFGSSITTNGDFIFIGVNTAILKKYTFEGTFVKDISVNGLIHSLEMSPDNLYVLGTSNVNHSFIKINGTDFVEHLNLIYSQDSTDDFAVLGDYAYVGSEGSLVASKINWKTLVEQQITNVARAYTVATDGRYIYFGAVDNYFVRYDPTTGYKTKFLTTQPFNELEFVGGKGFATTFETASKVYRLNFGTEYTTTPLVDTLSDYWKRDGTLTATGNWNIGNYNFSSLFGNFGSGVATVPKIDNLTITEIEGGNLPRWGITTTFRVYSQDPSNGYWSPHTEISFADNNSNEGDYQLNLSWTSTGPDGYYLIVIQDLVYKGFIFDAYSYTPTNYFVYNGGGQVENYDGIEFIPTPITPYATGGITAGRIFVWDNITAYGNIKTDSYFIGDGSQLTNLPIDVNKTYVDTNFYPLDNPYGFFNSTTLDLSQYLFTNGSNAVNMNIGEHTFTAGNITTVTVATPTNGLITQAPGSTFGYNGGYTFGFKIYAYKDGAFSTALAMSLVESAIPDPYDIDVTWDAVSGATKYRVVIYDDTYGYYYDVYIDVTTNSLHYDGNYDYYGGAGEIVPTPTSPASIPVGGIETSQIKGIGAYPLYINSNSILNGLLTILDPYVDTGYNAMTVTKSNNDYNNAGGENSHILMTNPSGSQNVVSSMIGGNMVAKWRTDNAGNINWVTYATEASRGHYFYTGGDYGDGGTMRFNIFVGMTQINPYDTNPIVVHLDSDVTGDDFQINGEFASGDLASADNSQMTRIDSNANIQQTGQYSGENVFYNSKIPILNVTTSSTLRNSTIGNATGNVTISNVGTITQSGVQLENTLNKTKFVGNINQSVGNFTGNQIYGEMYCKNDTGCGVVDLVTADVYVAMRNQTAGNNNGFTLNGASNLTAQVSGMYQINAKVAVTGGTPAGEYGMKLYLNETGQNNCYDHFHVGGDQVSMVITCMTRINAGQNVSIRFDDHASPVTDLTVYASNLNLWRVGN